MSEQNEKMNKKRRFKPLPLKVYLLYFIVATLIFTGVTLSRYSAEITSSDTARVAVAVAQMTAQDIKVDGKTDVLDANAANDVFQYAITVGNTKPDADLTAEVTLDYTMHIIIEGPHPALKVSMPAFDDYKGAKCSGQYEVTIEASDNDTELLFVPNDTLPAGVAKSNAHVLTLKAVDGKKADCTTFNIKAWAEIDQVD